MSEKLSSYEIRVLGCLMEKSLTTPEYYPLTLNALTNACNQKSNRNPVVDYDETEVMNTLDSLIKKGFAGKVISEGARTIKYRYVLPYPAMMNEKEKSIMCVLLLRGAQTSGELRTRTERMYNFSSLEEIDNVLKQLQDRETGALVKILERMPGQKENRVMHLMGNEQFNENSETLLAVKEDSKGADKTHELETEIASLKEHIQRVEEKLDKFIKQFE